jgi:60 kDa SS-A/Ro ribonucleoprotein
MARFNKQSNRKYTQENYEGETSFRTTPEMSLYSIVCTSALQPTFYSPNTDEQLKEIRNLIGQVDPLFVAQLAVYARTRMNLRTIPLVLTVELANMSGMPGLVRRLTRRVIQRADEITELLSYYVKANNREDGVVKNNKRKKLYALSNQIKKGIKDVFESGKFNEYQYAKYNRKTEIMLRDALFLSHPNPEGQKDLFNKIANNCLDIPYTWEVELSKAGQEGKDKKEVWEELIDSDKVGYMALLRNLRNIIDANVSKEHIYKVAKRIADPEQVRRSKQLPFRFLSAYRSLGNEGYPEDDYIDRPQSAISVFNRALESAVKVSIENIPMFENENVLIASDVSGSMENPVSPKSVVELFDIGILMSSLVRYRCASSTIGIFGDRWKVLEDLPENVLDTCNEMHSREGEVGYSTNGWKVINWCIRNNMKFDRVMIFTDCQMWDSTGNRGIDKMWKQYSKMFPQSKLYLFNLSPYNRGVPIDMRSGNVYLISGWSDAIFSVLSNIERGGSALDEIKELIV